MWVSQMSGCSERKKMQVYRRDRILDTVAPFNLSGEFFTISPVKSG
jgi:hypothetical protein